MGLNRDRIAQLADYMERHIAEGKIGFTMADVLNEPSQAFPDTSGNDCGTVACIAGWDEIMHASETRAPIPAASDDDRRFEMMDRAAERLGLNEEQAYDLFQGDPDPKTTTPGMAINTLRRLASTGAVKW